MKDEHYILHFSDIHTGELNIESDGKFKKSFDDFFYVFSEYVNNLILQKKPELMIFSGDLLSYGKENRKLKSQLDQFMKIFVKKQIPIITTNGNHDLNRELIEKGKQFKFYMAFIRKNYKLFKCKLSKNFKLNQASYLFLDTINTIFISINSCINIEMKYLNNKDDDFLKEEYLDVGIFSIEALGRLLEELSEKYGKKRFKIMNKILICHHPLDYFKESIALCNFLMEQGINIVFSGHIHEYDFQKKEKIKNFVAGSTLVKSQERYDFVSLREVPLQFNYYNVDMNSGEIKSYQCQYGFEGKWEINQRKTTKFDGIRLYKIEYWCKKEGIKSSKRDKLINKRIKGVFEKNRLEKLPHIIFITQDNQMYDAFLINESDTQLKVDQIKEWFSSNYDLIKRNEKRPLIVKNTGERRFISQLPEEFII